MQNIRIIAEGAQLALTIERLCYELIENHGDFSNSCMVGVQTRGAAFAERLHTTLMGILPQGSTVLFGKIDPTMHRDDFRMRDEPLQAFPTEMPFLVDKKRVILVDDVLYTGRTTRAALDALNDFGRPEQVELLCLADRRFNRSLPIRPDYVGITVDALKEAYLRAEWSDDTKTDRLLFYERKMA
jgi:pyrimidine operon attenuation protein / uracil phosphoribosyltransferase